MSRTLKMNAVSSVFLTVMNRQKKKKKKKPHRTSSCHNMRHADDAPAPCDNAVMHCDVALDPMTPPPAPERLDRMSDM